jgi:hypothetical protein
MARKMSLLALLDYFGSNPLPFEARGHKSQMSPSTLLDYFGANPHVFDAMGAQSHEMSPSTLRLFWRLWGY